MESGQQGLLEAFKNIAFEHKSKESNERSVVKNQAVATRQKWSPAINTENYFV